MGVCNVLVKAESIVQCESKVFEAVHCFYCVTADADGITVYVCKCSGVDNDKFFGFTGIELEVVIGAPVCEMGDGVLVC